MNQNPELLRKLKEEKAYRLMNERYRYYTPNVKCEEFVKAVGSLEYFWSLFSAANGVGKTALGANMLANLFWPQKNSEWFKHPMWENWPFLKRGRIVSDATGIENTIVPALKEWFPRGRYQTAKKRKSFESHWITDTGWEFDIMTYDQDPKEFEGVSLGWVWLDEPPPEAIFKACVSRLRRGGIGWITATPLEGSAWMYDSFVATGNDNSKETKIGDSDDGASEVCKAGKKFHLFADVWAACKDVAGTRGHLSREHIENMIANYSEEDKQARIHGKFQHLVGLVFKQFRRDVHAVKPFKISSRDFVVVEYLDVHPRNPDMVNWIAIDRQGRHFVVDELYIKCEGGTEELAERIKEKAQNFRIIGRYADPSAFNTDQHNNTQYVQGKSVADRLADQNLYYLPATKNRTQANKIMGDYLDFQQVGGEFIRAPLLYIFDTCPRTIWEIEHWQYNEWSGKTADKKGRSEKPQDKEDHAIENVGRAIFMNHEFMEEEEETFNDGGGYDPDPFPNT